MIIDSALEETAKTRAKEMAIAGELSHTRPDGSSCWTAFPDGLWAKGENIAAYQTSWKQVTESWKETNDPYSGQGHRRNMLNSNFNSVGIAGYKLNGVIYWAQDFGKYSNVADSTVTKPAEAFSITNNSENPEFKLSLPSDATGNFIVRVDGKLIDTKTLSSGKATITATGLTEGTHEALISYGGDSKYATIDYVVSFNVKKDASNTNNTNTNNTNTNTPTTNNQNNQQTTIKKQTPKITAKKATFKAKKKIKKYIITLKVGKKAVKKVWVTLKIKGKTIKAKTNNKGQAVFKITLKKKGTYKAKISFEGDKNYKAVSKKVTIKIK